MLDPVLEQKKESRGLIEDEMRKTGEHKNSTSPEHVREVVL